MNRHFFILTNLQKSKALKNVWAYTYIPPTMLGDGVGGYGYLKSNAYSYFALNKKNKVRKKVLS